MSITFGFFNSNNSDRLYSADDFNRLLLYLWPKTRGLMPYYDMVEESEGKGFDINSISGLEVDVFPGMSVVDSYWLCSDNNETFTLPAADVAFDRWDALVVKVDTSVSIRRCTLEIYQGTPAENPTKPVPPVRSDNILYLPVWWIFRPRGSSTVTKTASTYEYNNSAICYSVADFTEKIKNEVARLEEEIESAALMTESRVREIADEEINTAVGDAVNGSY